MPRGIPGRGRGYVLAEVLAAAVGALALLAAAQVYLHFWQLGMGGMAAVDIIRSAAVLQETLARDAAGAAAVRFGEDGGGLEFVMPDGGTVAYEFRDGQVFRGEASLARRLAGASFWIDFSGARPLVGVDFWGSDRRFRAAAAVGPP